jgi:hypothetical protein
MIRSKATRKTKRPAKSKHARTQKGRHPEKSSERRDRSLSEQMIDQTLEDSFPASDPPSWTTGREHSHFEK